jgi:hypothetical protein
MKNEYAYMAGLLDGEGYMGLSKYNGDRYKHKWTYKTRIIIANCNLELLEWVKNKFGGYISKKSNNPNWTQGYNLTIGYIDTWLPNVIPYMIGKKKKAILLLEAAELLKQRRMITTKSKELNLKRLEEINLLLREKEWLL